MTWKNAANQSHYLWNMWKNGAIYDVISKQGDLHEKKVSKYCQKILKGLEYLHKAGIRPWDLKCANIPFVNDSTCIFTDFRISK